MYCIFCNTAMDKGSQKPVDSRAVCRQHTAVLLWPTQLLHSEGMEASMGVSLAKGKSHFSSVAGAVKHMRPFKASPKGLSFQRSDCSHYFSTIFILHQGKVIKFGPPIFSIHTITLTWWYESMRKMKIHRFMNPEFIT